MNEKTIDIDKYVIFLLPIALVVTLLVLTEKSLFFSTGLIIVLFIYELLIYSQRNVYGYNGLKILAIPSIIILSFTIFIAIPSIYICSIKKSSAIYPYYFSIVSFYILYPLGLKFGNINWRISVKKMKLIEKREFHKDKIDQFFSEILILLLSIGILIFIDYLIRVRTIPLFEMIKYPGDYVKLSILREQAYKLLPVTVIERYLFLWERSIIFPIGIISSIFLYSVYKKKNYLYFFIIFSTLGILFNSLTLEKSPTAAIFLALISFFYLRKKNINFKFIVISIFLVFVFPVIVMYFKYTGQQNMFRLVYLSLLDRIFIVPAEVLYHYFDIFPDHHSYLLGRATHLFSWLHDSGIFPISNYVAKVWWKNPFTTGLANTNYIGNFWADFGIAGVVLSTFLVGFTSHWFYWKIITVSQNKKSILYVIATTISVPLFTFTFFSSNFTTLFFSRGLIILITFMIIISKIRETILNKSIVNSG